MKSCKRLGIVCLLVVGGVLPVTVAGCASDSENPVGAQQGLQGRDRDKGADGASRGAAGDGVRPDRDRDVDEAVDEAAEDDSDGGVDERDCRDRNHGSWGRHKHRDAGSADAGSADGGGRGDRPRR